MQKHHLLAAIGLALLTAAFCDYSLSSQPNGDPSDSGRDGTIEKTDGGVKRQYDVVVYIADKQIVAETKNGMNIETGTAGVHDDRIIQAALDSLKQGGKVLIRAGTYTISNMLLIKYSNTEVTGAGIDKTILFNTCVNAQPLGSGIVHSNVHCVLHSRDDLKLTGIVVRHMTIDGNKNQIPKDNGAMLSNVDDSGFEYVKVQNSIGGLYVTSWEQGIGGVGQDETGQHMEYTGLKFIRHCIADNCSAEGFTVCRSTNAEVVDNVVTRPWLFKNGWCHMINTEDSDHVLIKNNKVFAMPIGKPGTSIDGIQIVGATDVTVIGNYVDFVASTTNSRIHSLFHYTEGQSKEINITVVGNTFKGASIVFRNARDRNQVIGKASRVRIDENTVEDGNIFVFVDSNSSGSFSNVKIRDNSFSFKDSRFDAAIHIRSGDQKTDHVVVTNNKILNTSHLDRGIKLESVEMETATIKNGVERAETRVPR